MSKAVADDPASYASFLCAQVCSLKDDVSAGLRESMLVETVELSLQGIATKVKTRTVSVEYYVYNTSGGRVRKVA